MTKVISCVISNQPTDSLPRYTGRSTKIKLRLTEATQATAMVMATETSRVSFVSSWCRLQSTRYCRQYTCLFTCSRLSKSQLRTRDHDNVRKDQPDEPSKDQRDEASK